MIGLTCFLLTVIFIGAIFFKKKFTELVLGIVSLAPGEGSSSLDYWKRWFVRTMVWDLVTDLVTRGKYAFRKRKEGPPDIPPHTPPPDDRGQYLPPEAPPERREEARPPEETPSASAPLKPESVKQGAVVADRYTPRVSPPWEASRRPGHAESTEGFSEDGTAFLVFEGGEERGSLPEPGTPSEEPQAEDLRRAGQTLSSRRETRSEIPVQTARPEDFVQKTRSEGSTQEFWSETPVQKTRPRVEGVEAEGEEQALFIRGSDHCLPERVFSSEERENSTARGSDCRLPERAFSVEGGGNTLQRREGSAARENSGRESFYLGSRTREPLPERVFEDSQTEKIGRGEDTRSSLKQFFENLRVKGDDEKEGSRLQRQREREILPEEVLEDEALAPKRRGDGS